MEETEMLESGKRLLNYTLIVSIVDAFTGRYVF